MPINPDYVEKITDHEIVFRNYEGHVFHYPLKAGAQATPPGVTVPPVGVESMVVY